MKIVNLSKGYGKLKVIDNLNMEFEKNKINVILGESGCGKTTLLNMISGNISSYSGEIKERDEEISYIFQENNLIPWKTVFENLEFVLKSVIKDKMLRYKVIEENLKRVNLWEYHKYYPNELSGGMRKRVGIARAFAYPSTLVLMDEPFSSLDVNISKIIRDDFLKIQNINPKTIILVTHNIDIAVEMGEKIFILSKKPTRLLKTIEKKNYLNGKESIELKYEAYTKIKENIIGEINKKYNTV